MMPIVSSSAACRPPTISTIPIGNVGPMLVKITRHIIVYEYYTGHLRPTFYDTPFIYLLQIVTAYYI